MDPKEPPRVSSWTLLNVLPKPNQTKPKYPMADFPTSTDFPIVPIGLRMASVLVLLGLVPS